MTRTIRSDATELTHIAVDFILLLIFAFPPRYFAISSLHTHARHTLRNTLGVVGERRILTVEHHTVIGEQHTLIREHHTRIGERYTPIGERYMAIGEQYMAIGERYMAIGERYMAIGERYTPIGERPMAATRSPTTPGVVAGPSARRLRVPHVTGAKRAGQNK